MARSALPPSSNNEWLDTQGQVFQLCVIHEVEGKESIRSLVTIGGYSVCRECLDRIIKHYILSNKRSNYDIKIPEVIQSIVEITIINGKIRTDHA